MRVQAFFENERISDVNVKKAEVHRLDGLRATEIQIDATVKSEADLKKLVEYLSVAIYTLSK